MRRFVRIRRPILLRQNEFGFVVRSRRRDRLFKRAILLATPLIVAAILAAVPRGRYLVASLASIMRTTALSSIGVPTPRSEIDDRWRRFRVQGIADSKRALEAMFDDLDPSYRRLMDYAGTRPRTWNHPLGQFRPHHGSSVDCV